MIKMTNPNNKEQVLAYADIQKQDGTKLGLDDIKTNKYSSLKAFIRGTNIEQFDGHDAKEGTPENASYLEFIEQVTLKMSQIDSKFQFKVHFGKDTTNQGLFFAMDDSI